MPWGIDEIDEIALSVRMSVDDRDGLGFDSDAPFALNLELI